MTEHDNPDTMMDKCSLCSNPVAVPGRVGFTGQPNRTLCQGCWEKHQAVLAAGEQMALDVQREKYFEAICPPLYLKTDVARLRQKHPEQLADVMSWQYGATGLLLVGPTGVGKTRMAYLLLQRLIMEGVELTAFDCAGFAHELGRRFGRKQGTAEDWLDGLARRQLVFLDDVGKTPFTNRVEAELYALVDRRTTHLLPTIVTMNMKGQDLIAMMTADRGRPLVRRLREFSKIVSFQRKGE